MKIEVIPVTADLMLATITPRWWRQHLLGEPVETKAFVRTKFGWHSDATGHHVFDHRIEDALDDARSDVMRTARATSGISPPR